MTIAELVDLITNNKPLVEYLHSFPELNYHLQFLDMDDNKRSMNLKTRRVFVHKKDKIVEIELESIK